MNPSRTPGASSFGERSDVDDGAARVEARERLLGRTVVVKLVVVVVFDDGESMTSGQDEDLTTTVQGHPAVVGNW